MSIIHLPTENKNFTHIAHISDCHIRLTPKRHQEYKEVFDKLYKNIINTTSNNTAIFLLGDITNNKVNMAPECVDLTAKFLFNLASLRPTVLVAGNHDLLVHQKNRLDSLSPIVDALNHPNLFYLKQSGLYSLGNICINNYSVFDDPEKYLKGEDIPSVYRNKYDHFVCLFHGQVDGSITDLGFKLSNPHIPVSMFSRHDVVLLGDIHQNQQLKCFDETIIRYAGSLIQQNHGESTSGHGYTLWDLKSKNYKHIEIPNDYGFFSVILDNGIISTDLKNLPKKSRIRFQLKNTTPTEIKSALLEVRNHTEVIETCYQKLDKNETTITRIPTSEGNVVLGNINDKNYQIDLLKEYLKTKLQITNDQTFIDDIIKINDEMNDSIKKDDFARNIRWKPIKFEWSNLFSYGEDNIIDFTKMKNLMGLFAANTQGKSSIMSSITYCLFDKCERTGYASEIMNIHKTSFHCRFEFEIDGKRYFIERIGKKDKKGKVKVDVRFWKIENGKEIDLKGEQRKDTNEIIREYLGTYEDFVLTSLSVQNGKNNSSIIDMGNAERKDLFSQFMGLTIFDKLHEEANDRLKEKIIILKSYKNNDYTQDLINYIDLLKQAETLYKEDTEELSKIGEERNKIQQNILGETQKLHKLDVEIPPLNISELSLQKTQLNVIKNKEEITKIDEKLKFISKELLTFENCIKELENKNILEVYENYQKLLSKEKELDNEYKRLKIVRDNCIKIIGKEKLIEYDPNCNFCVKNFDQLLNEIKDAKKEMLKYEESSAILQKKFDENNTQLEKNKWCIDDYKNYQIFLSKRNMLKDERLLITNTLNLLNKTLVKFEDEIKLHEKHIELYKKNLEALKINETINLQIKLYKENLSKTEYSHKTKNQSVMDINSKISVIKNKIDEITKLVEKIKIVEKEYKLYDVYCQAVSRDGIPFDVITVTVPEIQNEVNNILSQTCEFTSLFETDGKNIIPYIVYDNEKKWGVGLTSGYEKFGLSLAIRIALINISTLPRSNFLVLDEGMSVMDEDNLSSLPLLFTYLKSLFGFIIIISHQDFMKESVDGYIEITKEEGFSKVNYV